MHTGINEKTIIDPMLVMKRGLKATLLISGMITASGCSSGYEIDHGATTLDGMEVPNKALVLLSEEFAKDSVAVYYKGMAIPAADLASFEALDAHYAKDKDKVYFCDEYRDGQNYYLTKKQTIQEVQAATPSSFVSMGDGYAKDGGRAFFQGKGFVVKDLSTFKPLDRNFSKDDLQAYLNGKPIKGSDGKSFELLDEFYSKDKDHVYFLEATGPEKHQVTTVPCNAAQFTTLEYPYSTDNTAVFHEGKRISGADAKSFNVLGNGYSKDRDAVYFEAKKLTAADVGHFKVLTLGYARDNTHVFYEAAVVEHADIATFKTYDHGFGDEDAEDVLNKYSAGKRVPGDATTEQ